MFTPETNLCDVGILDAALNSLSVSLANSLTSGPHLGTSVRNFLNGVIVLDHGGVGVDQQSLTLEVVSVRLDLPK